MLDQSAAPPDPATSGASSLKRQLFRFAMVGVVGTAAHYSILLAAVELLGLSPVIGAGAGFFTGLIASYILNRAWTFDARPAFGRGLATYSLVCIIGFAINVSIVALAVAMGVHYMVGQVIATPIAMLWNFLGSRLIVFR
ncbi:MAG: GtrA family protein [Alphaproteobacteria bacterium]|jgi:putative flippase GtrA|nr:MAG: GtrA family protein [Alphaproteobacteria bacterium]